MPTGTGRGRGGRGRGGSSEGRSNSFNDDGRLKVGAAWLNGDKADGYLDDLLADRVYLRVSLDDEFAALVPEGWRVFGYWNQNKKGKAPDLDIVALAPRD